MRSNRVFHHSRLSIPEDSQLGINFVLLTISSNPSLFSKKYLRFFFPRSSYSFKFSISNGMADSAGKLAELLAKKKAARAERPSSAHPSNSRSLFPAVSHGASHYEGNILTRMFFAFSTRCLESNKLKFLFYG